MVIASFAGVGKSYFAEHVDGAVDFPAMPYKYTGLDNPDITKEEAEKSKADPSHELNPEWPENYIRAIANRFHGSRYFIIPSDRDVLRGLQMLQIPYILVYPERDAREVYKKRFEDRGNTKDFLNIFYKYWDVWMDSLRRDSFGWCIELPKDKYLLDAKDEIDQIIDREEAIIHFEIDPETAEKAEKILREKYGLSIEEYGRRCLIWAVHHPGEAKKMVEKYGGYTLPDSLLKED